MTSAIPVATRTVEVPVEFFPALRALGQGPLGAVAMPYLRDAGHAVGVGLYDRFAGWLAARGEAAPEYLPASQLARLLAAFLAEAGWGVVGVEELADAVVAIDTTDWAEAPADEPVGTPTPAPSCHVTTGVLAGLFGRIAGAPLAVLEVECRATGAARCRFLLGSMDVLGYVHEAMERGIPYERAATSA